MSRLVLNTIELEIFGRSHDEYIAGRLKGISKGHKIDFEELRELMERRRPGKSNTSQRNEADAIEIISGFNDDTTNGETIEIRIKNKDVNSKDYDDLKYIPRPGHADFGAYLKYGLEYDMSGGGEFSGRLTAVITALGGIVIQILEKKGIGFNAELVSVHGSEDIDGEIKKAMENQDSVGGIIRCSINGLNAGIGGEYFDGIESAISRLIFAIPAVKGIEFGSGFSGVNIYGSENNDQFGLLNEKVKPLSNNAGGILGGISTGEEIYYSVAVKPTPSIGKTQKSVNMKTMEEVEISISGRHDPCVAVRACPVVEALSAIALADYLEV
ncbi:MAG: chorismate synthase [Clostridia bacterium]|nr:chorismate synthase [Clostridia bacterium]